MNGTGEEDDMPELPEVMESYTEEEIIAKKEDVTEAKEADKDEL